MKIMIDANTKWDLETAIMMSNKLYEFNIYWLEEPLNSLDVRSHKILREKSRIPIALGESLNNEYIFRDYIINNAVDIIQVDATKVSGITEWLKNCKPCGGIWHKCLSTYQYTAAIACPVSSISKKWKDGGACPMAS